MATATALLLQSSAHTVLCARADCIRSPRRAPPPPPPPPPATPAAHWLRCGRSVPRRTDACTHDFASAAELLPAAAVLRAVVAAGGAGRSFQISLGLKRAWRAQRAPRVVRLAFQAASCALRFTSFGSIAAVAVERAILRVGPPTDAQLVGGENRQAFRVKSAAVDGVRPKEIVFAACYLLRLHLQHQCKPVSSGCNHCALCVVRLSCSVQSWT